MGLSYETLIFLGLLSNGLLYTFRELIVSGEWSVLRCANTLNGLLLVTEGRCVAGSKERSSTNLMSFFGRTCIGSWEAVLPTRWSSDVSHSSEFWRLDLASLRMNTRILDESPSYYLDSRFWLSVSS